MKLPSETAADVVRERGAAYGTPHENFGNIAALWSGYLGKEVSREDVALLLTLLKVARLKTSPQHEDSQVDVCGYANTLAMLRKPDGMAAEKDQLVQASVTGPLNSRPLDPLNYRPLDPGTRVSIDGRNARVVNWMPELGQYRVAFEDTLGFFYEYPTRLRPPR